MRIPKSEFNDSDLALCRVHGNAVEQDCYSRMLVVEIVQEPEFRRGGHAVLPADLPLPPSYDADLAKWLSCLSGKSNSEQAAWEGWAARVCPSGDVEDVHAQWLKSSDFDDWFAENLGSSSVMKKRNTPATGDAYVSAKQPEQQAQTHSVCIKAHNGSDIGKVFEGAPSLRLAPEFWRPCDSQGWITHTPTADSVCPVPSDVAFEARYGDGTTVHEPESTRHGDCTILWRAAAGSAPCNDIVAWLPTGSAA